MLVKDFAKKYCVSERRVQYLIKCDRIPADKICGRYYIPDDTIYPADGRYSSYHFFTVRRQPLKSDNE